MRLGHHMSMKQLFSVLARRTANLVGTPTVFVLACCSVVIWAALGPHFRYSENWQLVINTGTTIVTFLLVFIIQNTQNHDAKAMHLKLDELIRAVAKARTGLVHLEELSDDELSRLEMEFHRLRKKSRVDDAPESTGSSGQS